MLIVGAKLDSGSRKLQLIGELAVRRRSLHSGAAATFVLMNCIGIIICLLLTGCGFVVNEKQLVGTWQVDLPAPQKIIYSFKSDHTYQMILSGQIGVLQGTWRLDGNALTKTLDAFGAYGVTNAVPGMMGLSTQKIAITKLNDLKMVWRTGLTEGMTLKRLTSGSSTGSATQ